MKFPLRILRSSVFLTALSLVASHVSSQEDVVKEASLVKEKAAIENIAKEDITKKAAKKEADAAKEKVASVVDSAKSSDTTKSSVETANPSDPEILELMESVMYRYQGETQISRQKLTTCAYKIKKGSIKCDSTPRSKTLQGVTKRYGEKLRDVKGFTLIVAPVSDNGIGILQYDYDEAGKDTDQWLYLPEVGSVKRVASSEDAPKSGALFGSEFSLEDLELPKMERFKWVQLDEPVKGKKSVVVIEQTPLPEHAKRTNYSKRKHWIDKDRQLILKTQYFAWNGELMKESFSTDIEKISEIWTPQKMIMRNLQSKRISILVLDQVKYNLPVADTMLEIRILNDAVFQSSMLKIFDYWSGS